MTVFEPMINFGRLKGFPQLYTNNKVPTDHFLEAAKEIVSCIESFGTLFKPVVYDMRGNIQKLTGAFLQQPVKYEFLVDMLLIEYNERKNLDTISSMLWLKRALQMMERFFTNILIDESTSENLRPHLKDAYSHTLQPHHNWIIQEGFGVIYRWIPNRSKLIGTGDIYIENIKNLDKVTRLLRDNLDCIDLFYINNCPALL